MRKAPLDRSSSSADLEDITCSQSRNETYQRSADISLRVTNWGLIALQFIVLTASAASACAQDVTTWHYDNLRSGVQPNETILNPSNVRSTTFGRVFSLPVSGDVYAQPLYLSQYLMSDGVLHNVLLVATAEDYVYAFDADGNNPAQGYIWRQSMLGPGETWVSYTDVNVTDIKPNIGVIGTPAVDRAGGTIYLVAKSKTTSGTVTFYQRLHALNIADGTEKLSGPSTIQATVNGTGEGGTTISFSPLLNNQRSALLLAPTPSVGSGNSVIIAWASHGDLGVYHGWVMAYDAANISIQNAAWADTPNGEKGGIWMTGGGPSSDGAGNIFLADGNGTFDANSGGIDYGDSAMGFTLSSSGLVVGDYFTPGDQHELDISDKDLGTGAVTLLPVQSGSVTNLMVTTDKTGTIYLINRDKMGGYTTPDDSSVQDFSAGYWVHNSFAFFNNLLFVGGDSGPLQAFAFDPVTELFSTTAQSKSSTALGCSGCTPSGSTPSISANGTANGIVWALDNGHYYNDPAILHAYSAANLGTELYNSTQAASSRDAAAIAIKFTTPTIASGRVYVGGRNAVTVYGLLSSVPPVTATPKFSPGAGTYTGTQTVKITDSTTNSSIYYTTDGTQAGTGSTPYGGSITVTSSETIHAIAVASGSSQSAEATAAYIIKVPAAQTQVPLSSVANTIGIYADGTKISGGGLNGSGSAYSKTLLGNSITYSGVTYVIGAANKKSVIRGTKAPVISLTSGKYAALKLLGAAVVKNQKSVTFKVTYTDGSAAKFTQSISDWMTPQHYAGESIALASAYCDTDNGGRTSKTYDLYQYSFTLNSSKTVKSLTMPSNSDVVLVAATLLSSN
jgi:Chitobiase/beta-hexosaminidase C-terminal domain